jgi:Spherulation-specific family 4
MANLLKVTVLAAAIALAAPARAAIDPGVVLKTTGVLVPLYVTPGKIWDNAIKAKYAHARVPMVVIANVENGPGKTFNPTYLEYIKKAQKAGIDVLGYVFTSYSKRPQATVQAEMLEWYDFYHTDGIFLDEMAVDNAPYYEAATAYAHAHALWFVVGNPGTNVPGDSGPDVINFYENRGYPSPALLKSSGLRTYGKARWSYIAGAVQLNPARVALSTNYVGLIYATDDKEPECYCNLPSYFSKLLGILDHR